MIVDQMSSYLAHDFRTENLTNEADPEYLAPDVLFDRDNRLMSGERRQYRAVAFQKRMTTAP